MKTRTVGLVCVIVRVCVRVARRRSVGWLVETETRDGDAREGDAGCPRRRRRRRRVRCRRGSVDDGFRDEEKVCGEETGCVGAGTR